MNIKQARTLLVGITLFALALALGGAAVSHARQGDVVSARAAFAQAKQESQRATDLIAVLTVRAGAAEMRADAEAAQADSLGKLARKAELRYAAAKAVAPDTCAGVIFAADTALAGAQAEAEMAEAGRRDAVDAANGYRAGKDSALVALARLRVAGDAVVHASRPSLLERVRPRITAGVTAGVNPLTYRPAVVIGVGLGWSF